MADEEQSGFATIPINFIECSICMDEFEKPKFLPCTHTFCLNCIEQYIQKKGDPFPCPTCRQSTKVPLNGFPNNTYVISIQDSIRSTILCQVCRDDHKSVTATVHCLDCKENLCEECRNAHLRTRLTKSHKICPVNDFNKTNVQQQLQVEQKTYCSLHSKPVEFFCKACQVTVCPECKVTEHHGHKCDMLDAASDKSPEHLQQQLDEAKRKIQYYKKAVDKINMEVKDSCDQLSKVEVCIESWAVKVQSVIMSRKEEMLGKVRQQKDLLLKQSDSLINGMEFDQGIIQSLCDNISHLAGNGKKSEILQVQAVLCNKIQQLEMDSPVLLNCFKCTLSVEDNIQTSVKIKENTITVSESASDPIRIQPQKSFFLAAAESEVKQVEMNIVSGTPQVIEMEDHKSAEKRLLNVDIKSPNGKTTCTVKELQVDKNKRLKSCFDLDNVTSLVSTSPVATQVSIATTDVIITTVAKPSAEESEVKQVEINIPGTPQHNVVKEENDKSNEKSTKQKESEKQKLLKYSYKKEGRIQYDESFLLQLQYSKDSMVKPASLPNIPDVILDKPREPSEKKDFKVPIFQGNVDFTPGYIRSPRGAMENRMRGGWRRSNQGGSRGQSREQRVITLPFKQEVKLHQTQNAWKMKNKLDKPDNPEETKTQDLLRAVHGILNKLTPQKFQTLVQQVYDLKIDSEPRLNGVINLIFEMAIDVPLYVVAYAKMCKCLMMIKVPLGDKSNKFVNFHNLLLIRCQREFERIATEQDAMKMSKKIENADTEEKKTLIKSEIEKAEMKSKRRVKGNIRFIGELFKLKMVSEHSMHDCLFKLLKAQDEDSLESLCHLLTNIGKDIDTPKARQRVDQYFHIMETIVKAKKTSSRVKFMIQDVIELRKNVWVPRRGDNSNPKTIQQIREEAASEERKKQVFTASLGHRGRKVDDGCIPVVKTSSKIYPSKMKISQNIESTADGNHNAHTAMLMDKIATNLDRLILKKKASNEAIIDWFKENVTENLTTKPQFIRTLVTCICKGAISDNDQKVDEKKFIKYSLLLYKYLDGKQEYELQALYALQALVTRLDHPPKMLLTFFATLYEEDIISKDAFNNWEMINNPAEQQGRDLARNSVKQFFTWLQEAGDEVEESI